MKKYYSDNKVINSLRVIVSICIFCIIALIYYSLYYIRSKIGIFGELSEIVVPTIIIAAALVIFYVIGLFFILPLWLRSICYILAPDEIILNYGLFFKRTFYIKISAIQYITVVKIPCFENININNILINAYGGRVVMMLLSAKDVEEIYRKIQHYIRQRGGL